MMYRSILTLCIAVLVMWGAMARPAAAQELEPTYRQLTIEASRLVRPAALMARSRIPARLDSLQGPAAVAVGEQAPFYAYTNADYAALPVKARWDFGDGTTAEGLCVRHRFGAPGAYTVTFTFANRHATVRDSLQVHVERPRVER